MAMNKVIKEFNNSDLIYKLGYNLWKNKVWPRFEIYKNKELLFGGYWGSGTSAGLFNFFAVNSDSYINSHIGTMKGMFNWLREYNEVPEEVEREFENIFIMYKLNDFNE